ncbi:translocation protein Sec62-domain-containing protein [Tricharina praecox]|uniref:translocation protein Sec62-domain-containing protein n=1 Tax=Tricharina praecox TaxID=43433 RepID=UPI002220D350|nr:translocation protein Sec62-domain-containing protein [Tricharina praecox]KAI5854040.1 translocation protein Sec62-domain-containing protein [Tricharina praecox]
MSGPPGAPTVPTPSPEAIAVADFLKGSPQLKIRTCILQGQRKDLFKVKRAIRALQSPEYAKACAKNPKLPKVSSPQTAAEAFSLLPRSLLALRVTKIEEEGPKNPKRVKGQWTVKVEPQQEIRDDLYYAFFYEPRTWAMTFIAVGLVLGLFGVVLFPLWPPMLRLGVWYLSMGMLGLIGLFLVMSMFRLILFVITMVVAPPGLWLYPNLFEDVGFFDSFRPMWAWHKVKKPKGGKAVPPAAPGISAPSVAVIPRKAMVEEVHE